MWTVICLGLVNPKKEFAITVKGKKVKLSAKDVVTFTKNR
jgi:hypothetical protein